MNIKSTRLSKTNSKKLNLNFVPGGSQNNIIHKISKTPKNINHDKNNIYKKKIIAQKQFNPSLNSKILNEYEDINNNISNKNYYNQLKSTYNLSTISTFDKVVMLQKLLKELSSIKGIFEENIYKLEEKINKKCFEYFRNKISIKKILDHCDSYDPEEHKDYILVKNAQNYLEKELYSILSDFYFLIRNENYLMLKIIQLSEGNINKELSDFFINFFYENLINSSFIQDEILLMIYLLLDNLFFESFPNHINLTSFNNNILYNNIINKNSFLYWTFQSLTRKIDVKNFLYLILGKIILKMEKFRIPLTTDLKIANKFLDRKDKKNFHSFTKLAGGEMENPLKKKKKRNNDLSNIRQGFEIKGNIFLKRTNNFKFENSITFNNEDEDKTENKEIVNNFDKLNLDVSLENKYLSNTNLNKNNNKNNIKNDKNFEIKNEEINEDLTKKKQLSATIEEKIEIDSFFENNSVTYQYLDDKLKKLNKEENLGEINYAMKDYIKYLIYKLELGKKIKSNIDNNMEYSIEEEDNYKDKELFSTSLIIEELMSIRKIKNSDSFGKLMRKIKINYKIMTKIISKIINNIKENLFSSPYIIKYISKLLITLLEKKYKGIPGNKLTTLNIYIFKLNFFIGNIILPIIKNPEINGIITSELISQITKDNLKIINDIFNKILSLNLFNKYTEPYMTIFNPFIIEIMPQLFEIIEIIDKGFIIPSWIQKLINEKNIAGNIQRNINYDYFKKNKNENMQCESICFSWENFFFILSIILKNEEKFKVSLRTDEHKQIFDKIIRNKNIFINLYMANERLKVKEFFLLTKINFREEFKKEMKSIIKGDFNVDSEKSKIKNNVIFYIKKCFSNILEYTKVIEKNDFISIELNKDEIIYDLDLFKKIKAKNYSTLIKDNYKDINFKRIIFPKILENIKFEIGTNTNNDKSKKILFSGNYLNLYINHIPNEYSNNNFDLLFKEMIRETEFSIEYIKNDVLFQYYSKIKELDKNILKISKYSSQILNLEKWKCIEYLYNKLRIPYELNIQKDSKGLITNIDYNISKNINDKNEENVMTYLKKQNQPINYFIGDFPDFDEYKEYCNNIFDLEEKVNASEVIYNYFSDMIKLIKEEKIIKRFDKKKFIGFIYDMENYLFTLLYDKLFPYESTKDDLFFYNKCSRLSFITPENVDEKIKTDKNLIDTAIEYLNDLDDELTPVDKIKIFGKVIEIIQNSIYFSSGKTELGVDDVLKPLIYTLIKAKPKNICSNYQYCELYLNTELAKTQYGIILSQIGLVIEVIKKMKYNDLINVSEEQFGKDEFNEEN